MFKVDWSSKYGWQIHEEGQSIKKINKGIEILVPIKLNNPKEHGYLIIPNGKLVEEKGEYIIK